MPRTPRAVSSRPSVPSASRRADSFGLITRAATFCPWKLTGPASGAFQLEMKRVEAQASEPSATAPTKPIAIL